MPETMSVERVKLLEHLGAEVVLNVAILPSFAERYISTELFGSLGA